MIGRLIRFAWRRRSAQGPVRNCVRICPCQVEFGIDE